MPRINRAGRRSRVFGIVAGALFLLLAVSAFTAWHLAKAYRAGVNGKTALINAEHAIGPGQFDEARRQLESAGASFRLMDIEIGKLGPIAPVMRVVPLVRIQIRAADKILQAGQLLTEAGINLADAADQIRTPAKPGALPARPIDHLATIHTALASGADKAEEAVKAVRTLEGKRLVGPLAPARDELLDRLVPVARQARSAEEGVAGLQAFFGEHGPRRYLVFSQNPEEVRPTGGYMGSYSIMSTTHAGLQVEESAGIEVFQTKHPDIVVPEDKLGGVFKFEEAPSIANTNFLADWSVTGRLARDLWKQSGEKPVDGVLGITPAFLVQVLKVTGPVEVGASRETVSADNLISRFTFHTQQVGLRKEPDTVRKQFGTDVAAAVLSAALELPTSRWEDLARALGESFNAREAMAWSRDTSVTKALAAHRWDGTLPQGRGDFFYNAEFAYAAKNGRTLRRSFDHHVVISKDGSAVVTTTTTIENPTPRDNFLNTTSMLYVTSYGPTGAVFHDSSSTSATPREVELSGHPAAGFFIEPPPKGQATLKVVWRVPKLALDLPGNDWQYALRFMHLPDHTGDVVNLRVELPRGWTWRGPQPPASTPLDRDLVGSWTFGP